MKTLIIAAGLLFSVSAQAENVYIQNQKLSCKAIADAVAEVAAKQEGIGVVDAMQIHEGTFVLCVQSYNQASADYSIAKAKANAMAKAGPAAAQVVELSYQAYHRDQK